jgi:hypothetical protein
MYFIILVCVRACERACVCVLPGIARTVCSPCVTAHDVKRLSESESSLAYITPLYDSISILSFDVRGQLTCVTEGTNSLFFE